MFIDGLRPLITLGGRRVASPAIHCRVTLIKGRGDRITGRSRPFHNLVTAYGLNGLAASTFGALSPYCHVGTGSAEPAAGDVNLASFFASTNNVISSSSLARGLPPYYSKYVRTWRLVAGTFDGEDISEVGLSDSAAGDSSHLFSRALPRDAENVVAPVRVRSDEWLDVTYEFRLYPDHVAADGSLSDGAGVVTLDAVDYDYTIRPAFVSNVTYWDASTAKATLRAVSSHYAASFDLTSALGAVAAEPTSPSGANVTTTPEAATYVPGSFERDVYLILREGEANATGGIGALRIHTGFGAYQVAFDPPLPKDADVNYTIALNLSWASTEQA